MKELISGHGLFPVSAKIFSCLLASFKNWVLEKERVWNCFIYFILFCFWATRGSAQGLLLALRSGISAGQYEVLGIKPG